MTSGNTRLSPKKHIKLRASRRPAVRRPRLYLFAKEPRAGRVKTRLAREIGVVAATWWFRGQARRVARRLARDPRWDAWIAVTPDRDARTSGFWPSAARRVGQGSGDLGARMARVFRAAPPGPVVIVGADVPGITAAHVRRAFVALGRADAVFGPAADGGFWLVGLARGRRRAPARIFECARWSTEFALEDAKRSLGVEVVIEIDTLRDVDDAADLRELFGAAI